MTAKRINDWWQTYSAHVASALSMAAIVTMIGGIFTFYNLRVDFKKHVEDYQEFIKAYEKRTENDDQTLNFLWEINGVQNEMIYKLSEGTKIDLSKEKANMPKYKLRGL